MEFELVETRRLQYRVIVEAVDSGRQRPATREELVAALGCDDAETLRMIAEVIKSESTWDDMFMTIMAILRRRTDLMLEPPDAEPTQPSAVPDATQCDTPGIKRLGFTHPDAWAADA